MHSRIPKLIRSSRRMLFCSQNYSFMHLLFLSNYILKNHSICATLLNTTYLTRRVVHEKKSSLNHSHGYYKIAVLPGRVIITEHDYKVKTTEHVSMRYNEPKLKLYQLITALVFLFVQHVHLNFNRC